MKLFILCFYFFLALIVSQANAQPIPMDSTNLIWQVQPPFTAVYKVVISPDNRFVVADEEQSNPKDTLKVRIYNIVDGTLFKEFIEETSAYYSRDGSILLTKKNDTVVLRNASTFEIIKKFDIPHISQRINVVFDISPDNKFVAFAGLQYCVQLYDINTGLLFRTINKYPYDPNHTMGPGANTVEYSSDGKKILISSEWSIYYDLEKDTVLKIFNGRYPKFCPDNIHFVNNWADDLGNQRVYIYDLSNTTPEFSFSLYNADYCFSPDGKYLFVEGDPDRTVLVWDMITKQKIYTYPRMKYGYRCITASKDGNYIATSNAQIVYLFALRTTSVLDDYQTITLLSPNPTNNMVRIDFILQNSEIVNLRILNNSGQTLNTISLGFRESGNNSYSYDVSGLPSGIYFITLQTASISQTYKLVKE